MAHARHRKYWGKSDELTRGYFNPILHPLSCPSSFLTNIKCFSFTHASLMVQMVKNLPAMQETWFDPWVGKIPCRREWLTSQVFLPGEFHGQKSLLGYSLLQRVEHYWATNIFTHNLKHHKYSLNSPFPPDHHPNSLASVKPLGKMVSTCSLHSHPLFIPHTRIRNWAPTHQSHQ